MKIVSNGVEMKIPFCGNLGVSEEVYSTEEIAIGRWIDGKPLYQIVKMYSKIAFASNDNTVLETLPTSMNVVSMAAFLKTTNWAEPISYFDSTTYFKSGSHYSFSIRDNPKRITLTSTWTNSYPPVMDVALTLKYTKTTDQATIQIFQNEFDLTTDSIQFSSTPVTASDVKF